MIRKTIIIIPTALGVTDLWHLLIQVPQICDTSVTPIALGVTDLWHLYVLMSSHICDTTDLLYHGFPIMATLIIIIDM